MFIQNRNRCSHIHHFPSRPSYCSCTSSGTAKDIHCPASLQYKLASFTRQGKALMDTGKMKHRKVSGWRLFCLG
ncbi:hypothetical protein AV530_015457 [Patagioenas fasciata monilis]|uniref:Uncharacterized protein n=1 Tax=Patagioenas fasciata monilis TaxID=372326 RepID=A0A1V4KRN4_PATFA|nr:hypothetical protein AV530_015457 [Patagioenas fasciata monilis]